MDILETIVAHKRTQVAAQKKSLPPRQLAQRLREQEPRPSCSMRRALEDSPSGIIAEFKRRSPSKGWLHPDAQVREVVSAYERAGAAACSVLTDTQFFGGADEDLCQAREAVKLPLLRKDFVVDGYQLLQAKALGADAVLLIAAVLRPAQCVELAAQAHELGMEVLLEVHAPEELSFLNPYVDMLGVNNRHLGTFHTEVEHSFRMARQMALSVQQGACGALLVSESGLQSSETILRLREEGFRGFLMGEYFMKTEHPGARLAALVAAVERKEEGER